MFITFEGIEGSGKTTQSKMLLRRLRKKGHNAVRTFEPGGTRLGLALRRLLKGSPTIAISPRAELLLFNAARAELVEEIIRPCLAEGAIVICDRYAESTLAYQGGGRGLPLSMLVEANAVATGGLRPDLIVLVDLDPAVGLTRKRARGWDRFETEELDFHRRVRETYLDLAQAEPDRWLVVDGRLSATEIQEILWQALQPRLCRV